MARRWMLPVLLLTGAAAASADPAALEQGLDAWRGGLQAEALALWRPLAEAGDARAQLFLGYAYHRGKGVPADDREAALWYRRAAEQGVADAQYQLGLLYELGYGVARDMGEADYWYGRAIGQGFCPGELRAGGELGDR